MTVDLGSIQYNVEADTSGLDAANAAVDQMAEHMDDASKATDELSKKTKNVANAAGNASSGINQAANSTKGLSSVFQQAGFQFQDAVVQLQGGANAALVFSQQGSQLLSTIHPLVGLAAALAGVIGGQLLAAFGENSQAAEELQDNLKGLVGELDSLTDAQKSVVNNGIALSLADQSKAYAKHTQEIDDQIKKIEELNEANGKRAADTDTPYFNALKERFGDLTGSVKDFTKSIDISSSAVKEFVAKSLFGMKTGYGQLDLERIVDNTNALKRANEDLIRSEVEHLAMLEERRKIDDPKGLAKKLSDLKDEVALREMQTTKTGMQTQAYYELEGAQKGYRDGLLKEYTAVRLLQEQNKADEDQAEKVEKLRVATNNYLSALSAKMSLSEKEIEQNAKVTEGQKLQASQDLMLVEGKIKLSAADKERSAEIFKQIDANTALADARKKQIADDKALLNATENKNKSLDGEIQRQKEINERYRNGELAASALEQAYYDLAIAQAENAKAAAIGTNASPAVIKALDDQIKKIKELKGLKGEEAGLKINADNVKETQKIADDLAGAITDGLMRGFESGKGIVENFKDVIQNIFKTMVLKPTIDIASKQLSESLQGLMAKFSAGDSGKTAAGGANGQAAGAAISQGGIYGAIAVAVVAGASIWNKQQDEKFSKMNAAYRQQNQSLSAILGEGNKKSETISNSIDRLNSVNGNVLNVNYDMLSTLIDIRAGIGNVAAGFAKTLIGSGNAGSLGIDPKKDTFGFNKTAIKLGDKSADLIFGATLGNSDLSKMVQGIMGTVTTKISQALYSKKTELTDTGIGIIGNSLANIISGATLEAFSYADTKTTKKILGIKSNTSTNRTREDLNDVFEQQITSVFESAGDALKKASSAFGINFDDYINQLNVKTQDLSLKGLEGDALTKEIESFFGSTMDNWASVLLGGTSVLLDFQQIGESAFDTMLRLATETNNFSDYAKRLNLNFHEVGMAAVYTSQTIAELAGGFENLESSLATYYDKFFSETDKFNNATESVSKYFAELNIAVPQSRDAFKSLVEAIDITTDAGAKQFSALIAVSGAMDEYLSQLEKQKEALVGDSYSALQRAVAAQKKILDSQIDVITKSLSASQAVYDALHSTLNGLVIDSVKTQEATRRQAQAQLSDMLLDSRNGKTPDIDALNRALSTISRPSENLYSTFEDYAKDFYNTASVIKELQDAAGTQISTEEKALAALEKQSAALDETLEWAKRQVDAINGVNVSVLTVAQALNNFSMAVGVQVPQQAQDAVNAALAAASVAPSPAEPTVAEQAAKTQVDALNSMMKDFGDFVKASQIAIADNTDKIYRVLDKFDKDGLPPERELS